MEARHDRNPRAARSESIEKTWSGRSGGTGAGITAATGCEWQRTDPRSGPQPLYDSPHLDDRGREVSVSDERVIAISR